MIGYRKRLELAQMRLQQESKSVVTHFWKAPNKQRGGNPNYLAAKINGKLGRKAAGL